MSTARELPKQPSGLSKSLFLINCFLYYDRLPFKKLQEILMDLSQSTRHGFVASFEDLFAIACETRRE
jgi:hypothetical protein